LYNRVALDVLGIGYEQFPRSIRDSVVARYSRMNFKQEIVESFLGRVEHKTLTTAPLFRSEVGNAVAKQGTRRCS
jgi:hypothetical protein